MFWIYNILSVIDVVYYLLGYFIIVIVSMPPTAGFSAVVILTTNKELFFCGSVIHKNYIARALFPSSV